MAARRVLIVSEKPMMGNHMEAFWARHHPDDEVSHFYTPPMGSFRFRLPRDLPISRVPIIEDLDLQAQEWRSQDDGSPSVFDRDFARLAGAADLLVFATDFDAQGSRNVLDLLKFHAISTPLDEIVWLPCEALTAEDLEAVHARDLRASHPDLTRLAGFGWAKQRFDHLWMLNALPVLGATMRAAGIKPATPLLSKYALQLLLMLKRSEGERWLKKDLVKMMSENPLSKKESPIATPISRSEIINWLTASNLIEQVATTPQGSPYWALSTDAERLISLLHKDCFDPDLAARIKAWGAAWPASEPVIERYIRTWFGKQKRFLDRHLERAF